MSVNPTHPAPPSAPPAQPVANQAPPAVDPDHDGDSDAGKTRPSNPPGVGRLVDKDV